MKKAQAESTPESTSGGPSIRSVPDSNAAHPRPRRYFERPDPDARPLSFGETLLVVLSTHLGVRTREQRQEDFRRANGLHLFIAGVVYFALLIGLLILLAVSFSDSR